MKNKLLYLILILLINCKEKVNLQSTENISSIIPEKLVKFKPIRKTLVLKLSEEKLKGKYYVEFLHPKRSIHLKKEKPKNEFILYSLDFKYNGKIEFKDLTKSYYCGTGVLSLKNLKYELNNRDNYELQFEGKFEGQSKFKFRGEYRLAKTEKNEDYLSLINIVNYEETDFY